MNRWSIGALYIREIILVLEHIWVVEVTDSMTDCSWKWAFQDVPNKHDIHGAVLRFTEKWMAGDPDMIRRSYPNFVANEILTKFEDFSSNLAGVGRTVGKLYIRVDKIEIVY